MTSDAQVSTQDQGAAPDAWRLAAAVRRASAGVASSRRRRMHLVSRLEHAFEREEPWGWQGSRREMCNLGYRAEGRVRALLGRSGSACAIRARGVAFPGSKPPGSAGRPGAEGPQELADPARSAAAPGQTAPAGHRHRGRASRRTELIPRQATALRAPRCRSSQSTETTPGRPPKAARRAAGQSVARSAIERKSMSEPSASGRAGCRLVDHAITFGP